MISDAASYVADRLTESAAERLGPIIAWGAAVAAGVLAAVAFGLVALYAYLAPVYGELEAASAIAAGALLFVVVLWTGRWINRKMRRPADNLQAHVEETLAAVDDEAGDVIDYFGSAKVLATAFMFGFSAARQIKR